MDTLRSDRLPAYGYRGVETPNIDALRRDSILYERAYSPCPMTLPAHMSIFTGLPPTEHEVRNNIGYRFDGAKFTTLAEKLRQNGYATGAAVSSYVLRSDTGIDDGFDSYEDSIPVAASGATSEHQRSGSATLEHAIRWLEANRGGPFFLFFHIYEPHAPYSPPEPFQSRYSDPYNGEIAASDAIVGKLVDRLRTAGLYDRSLIVLLSDHGEGLWDHGEDQHGILLYRESLQVPLMVKPPLGERRGDGARGRRGERISEPFALSAVYHEVLDIAGIEKSRPADAPIYSETLYPRIHLGWSELRSLIQGKYHYIDGPSPELYDLERDPSEKNNIISSERRMASALRRELQSYPSDVASIGQVDPEEAAKLAALGYIGTPKDRSGPLPNPRDEIGSLQEVRIAFRLAAERQYDEAAAKLRRLLQVNPRLLDVSTRLGEVLIESGRYEEAVAVYQQAIQYAPRLSPDLALAMAGAYLKSGRVGEAISHAEAVITSAPREAEEILARAAAEQKRFRDALDHARKAVEAGGQQPRSFIILAEIQRAAGDLEAALRSIEHGERRAAELEMGHLYGADFLRGDVLARLDRPEQSIAAYRREIRNSPQHLQAYANLALIHMIQQDRAEAMRLLDQMAAANPHRGAYLLAARTLEVFGDQAGAARWRQRATP